MKGETHWTLAEKIEAASREFGGRRLLHLEDEVTSLREEVQKLRVENALMRSVITSAINTPHQAKEHK